MGKEEVGWWFFNVSQGQPTGKGKEDEMVLQARSIKRFGWGKESSGGRKKMTFRMVQKRKRKG